MSSERRFGAFGHVPPASSPLSEIPSFLRETPNGAINKVEVKRRRSDAQTSKNHKSGDPTVDIRFHNEPDTYVAHYTRCDIALDLILKHRRIRLGPLTATNDPRETKGWSFAVGVSWFQDGVSHQDGLALAKRNIDFNRIIRSGCRVFCVSEDKKNAFKLGFHNRSYGKPRMWAQYGGNHTGVCLLFDKQVLGKEIANTVEPNDQLLSGKVEYGNFFEMSNSLSWLRYMEAFDLSANEIAKDGLELTLSRHRDNFIDVFFFNKSLDWEHEDEFRWIIRGTTNDPLFVNISDSLRAILLGVDFPRTRLLEVHEYCSQYDACVARIIWINGQPFVDWVPPNEFRSHSYKDIAENYHLLP